MADFENKYHQVCQDCVVASTFAREKWSKARIGVFWGCSLLLLSFAAAAVNHLVWSGALVSTTSSADATDLFGVPSIRRSLLGLPMKSRMMDFSTRAFRRGNARNAGHFFHNGVEYDLGSSPWMQPALDAIEANNRRNHLRDISIQATTGEAIKPTAAEGEKNKSEVEYVLYGDGVVRPMKTKEELAAMDEKTRMEFFGIKVDKKNMAGIAPPTGFFDPLGLSAGINDGELLFFREAEIKHGRVAMLASLGILVGEQFHPLFGGNIDVPAYIAFQQTPLQTFWPAVLLAVGYIEYPSVFTFEPPTTGKFWQVQADRVPGDLGFDPLGLKPKDPKELKDMQTKELNNGRLAMLAAAGMLAQELRDGQKIL